MPLFVLNESHKDGTPTDRVMLVKKQNASVTKSVSFLFISENTKILLGSKIFENLKCFRLNVSAIR